MENKILVVRFGDNDFTNSLFALGKYIMHNMDYETIAHLEKTKELNEFLTMAFRHILVLHQFDFNNLLKDNKDIKSINVDKYSSSNYFIINNTELKITYEDEYDNGETLIVDFYNNEVKIV